MPLIVQQSHYGWLDTGDPRSGLYRCVLDNPDKEELNYVPVQRELNNVRGTKGRN